MDPVGAGWGEPWVLAERPKGMRCCEVKSCRIHIAMGPSAIAPAPRTHPVTPCMPIARRGGPGGTQPQRGEVRPWQFPTATGEKPPPSPPSLAALVQILYQLDNMLLPVYKSLSTVTKTLLVSKLNKGLTTFFLLSLSEALPPGKGAN